METNLRNFFTDRKGKSQVNPLIFISHIFEHKKLAMHFKIHIQQAFDNQVDVFVSSDIHNIAGGDEWKKQIKQALRNSSLFIALLNDLSLKRHWINLEIGCAWISDVPILALCMQDTKAGSLPKPYDDFQALDISSPYFYEELLVSIEKQLGTGMTAKRYPQEFSDQLKSVMDAIPEDVVQSPDDTGGVKAGELSSEEVAVLLAINNGNDNIEKITASVGIASSKCEYYLGQLKKKGLISSEVTVVGLGSIWGMKDAGREYLFDTGHLE